MLHLKNIIFSWEGKSALKLFCRMFIQRFFHFLEIFGMHKLPIAHRYLSVSLSAQE